MNGMLMTQRSRANSKRSAGHGGRNCTCCDVPRVEYVRVRRAVRRTEKAKWRREAES